MEHPIYHPQEDSYLLKKNIKEYAEKAHRVLDVGTGTGILAIEAAKYAQKVVGIDINDEALAVAKANADKEKLGNITFKHSDLFSDIKEKFDLIICNPPYLPADKKYQDIALDGGKKGYEFIKKLINNVNDILTRDGIILLLFSSLTKKDNVEDSIKKNLLTFEKIDQEKLSFETLYVYELKKTELRKKLEYLNISDITYFTRGHRGILFIGVLKNKRVVIKATNESSKAFNRIANEATILRKIEKHNLAPVILYAEEDFLVYEFIEGKLILDFIEQTSRDETKKVLNRLFEMMYLLDTLHITKEEMHHPVRHILITKNKEVKLLDFERSHYTDAPKNVTQFCQFLMMGRMKELLSAKGINSNKQNLIKHAKKYRTSSTREHFEKILQEVLAS